MLVELLGLSHRSLENPAFSLNDSAAFDLFTGGMSSSGETINRDKALMYPPMWRGVSLISRDVAKLPLIVYKRSGEGKERDPDHPAYDLLRYKPNRYMTSFIFRQTLQAHALLKGNGYAYIFRDQGGDPLEILPLNPDSTYPVRENGRLWYVTKVNNEDRKLDPDDVIHIKGLGFDGLIGYDVITYARDALGRGIAAGNYAAKFFANSARPSVVIEHPAKLGVDSMKRLRESWNAMHQGLDNSHKTAILEEGMKLHAFSTDPEKAQLLELREFEVRDAANILNLPPHKLGDTTRTAFASLEQENQSYLDDALDPWLVVWEEECRDKLLTERQKRRDSHLMEFLRNALVRADLAARTESQVKRVTNGLLTLNEARAQENMNPVEGGDVLLVPLNIVPLDMLSKIAAANAEPAADPAEPSPPSPTRSLPEPSSGDEINLGELFFVTAARMIRRISTKAMRLAKRGDEEFEPFLNSLELVHGTVISAAFKPILGCLDRSKRISDALCRRMRDTLMPLYDSVSKPEFYAAVSAACREMERSMPISLMEETP